MKDATHSPATKSLIHRALQQPIDVDGIVAPPLIPPPITIAPVAAALATKAESDDVFNFNFDHPSRLTPEDIEEEKDGDSTIVPDEPGNKMDLHGWPQQKEK